MFRIAVPSCIFVVAVAAIEVRIEASRRVVSPNHRLMKPLASAEAAISGMRCDGNSPLPLSIRLIDNLFDSKGDEFRIKNQRKVTIWLQTAARLFGQAKGF